MKRLLLFFIVSIVLLAQNSFGDRSGLSDAPSLEERLGERLPLGLTFSDERGRTVRLADEIERPVILTLVYFNCEHICPQVLSGLSEALERLDLTPGRDYRVITLSFDEGDTPETALGTRSNYLSATARPFPEGSWKFLTGDGENIRRLTSALGFSYRREAHGFIHPVVLVILSPGGRITRYIPVSKYQYGVAYRVTFSPVELAASLREASQGKVGCGPAKSGVFCFPEEPKRLAGFFRLLGVAGAVTLLGMLGLFVYLRGERETGRKEG